MKARTVLACLILALAGLWSLGAQGAETRRFALLVGINQYADTTIIPLQKAHNDAIDLGAQLGRLGGFAVVKTMTSNLDPSDPLFPTRENILHQVELLAEQLEPTDQVVFFFSGHGLNDTASGESYLLPRDARAKNAAATSINLQKEVLEPLVAKTGNVVALVDACQKALTRDKGIGVSGVDQVKASGRAVVITATSKGNASYEDPKGPYGLFTAGIMAALAGGADLNRDGAVGVAELADYLPKKVGELALAANVSQKPVAWNMAAGALQPVLVKVGLQGPSAGPAGSRAQVVQFRLPGGVRADIRILAQDGREVITLPDTLEASTTLEPGSYQVVAQDKRRQYYEYRQTISVANARLVLDLNLKPNFGTLSIRTVPADGVEVLVNGRSEGFSAGGVFNLTELRSGTYEVVLSAKLHDTQARTITIEDGRITDLEVVLQANGLSEIRGTLKASTRPEGPADLYLNGARIGTLPLEYDLPPGEYVVEVRMNLGGRMVSDSRTVAIRENRTTAVQFDLRTVERLPETNEDQDKPAKNGADSFLWLGLHASSPLVFSGGEVEGLGGLGFGVDLLVPVLYLNGSLQGSQDQGLNRFDLRGMIGTPLIKAGKFLAIIPFVELNLVNMNQAIPLAYRSELKALYPEMGDNAENTNVNINAGLGARLSLGGLYLGAFGRWRAQSPVTSWSARKVETSAGSERVGIDGSRLGVSRYEPLPVSIEVLLGFQLGG